MKKFQLFTLVFLFSSQVFAAGDWGYGFMVGYPTGITAKKILANGRAFDAGAGWSLGGHTNFQIHSDWLFNKQDALYWNDKDPMDLYFGIGGRMKFADDIEVGVRIPLGLAYFLSERQLEIFTELAPIWDFLPSSEIEAQFMIGMRYYL